MDSIFVRWWEIIDLASHTPQIGFSPDYSEYYVLTYDKTGKHIETLDYHRYINEHNHPLQWYPWEHYIFEYNADDLISGYLVEITYFSSSYRNNEQDLTNNVLSLLFPEMPDCRMATPFPECNSEKDAYQYRKRVSFTYEGGNVVHAESKEMDGFEEEEVYDYTYTSYPNPFFKMFVNRSPFLPYNAQSPNLVQTIRVQEFLSPMIVPVSTEIWEYEMEKDFPVKATCHGEVNYEGIEGDTIYLTKTYTWTYYYEYVE